MGLLSKSKKNFDVLRHQERQIERRNRLIVFFTETHIGFLFDLGVGQCLFRVLVVLLQRVFELLSVDEAAVVGVKRCKDPLGLLIQLSLIRDDLCQRVLQTD